MDGKHKYQIEKINWEKAKKSVLAIDKELYKIINELSVDDSYAIYKANYPYGTKIYEDGLFYLPVINSKTHTLPINDASIPQNIKNDLCYHDLPLGMITKGSFEVFRESSHRVFSLALRKKGLELGIWEMFAPTSPYTVTSGSRSLFLLPKIADALSHKKLRAYGVRSPQPRNLLDQWAIFKELIAHQNIANPWTCEILLFSSKWIETMKKDPAWLNFYHYTLKKAWDHTEASRTIVTYNAALERFSHILIQRRIKPSPYILETLKHLIFITVGAVPAFKPAGADNSPAPIDEILKTYLNVYGLKTYYPSMLYSDYLQRNEPDSVYYSLQLPISLEKLAGDRYSNSAKTDLIELIELTNSFIDELNNGVLGAGSHHIQALFSKTKFDFFHTDADPVLQVSPASQMAIDDRKLLYLPEGDYGERKFSDRCHFVKGCVRVSSE